ncbi:MAG: CPBP family intramembrane metalloprotease [Crocinitomicaceae bacterium]|nr:CPBP family intramembrane metalloprotease [Crocinitomicaceae bacterium]
MIFLNQWSKGQGNLGTYVLTFCTVVLALFVGQFIVEVISNSVLGFSLIAIPENVNLNLVLSLLMLPFGFALIALMLCVRYLHKRPVLSFFTARDKFDWKRFFLAAAIWGGILVVFLIISIVLGQPIGWNFNARQFFPLLLISLFLIPIQTTAEEALFRGYLFQAFGSGVKKGWIAILLTGLLFGLLHVGNPEVAKLGDMILVFYISTGIFLGILTHMDDGIELGMGYHAVNNIFGALILTNDWQAFQTNALFIDHSEPTFGWDNLLTILLLQPVLLFLFSRIYRWKNWKGKLFK